MGKYPISVTLDGDNVTWLRARVAATGARSVSELLDRLVTDARTGGTHVVARSVVGTIDVDPADPLLNDADAAIADLFDRSVRRPMLVKKPGVRHAASATRKARRRG